MRTIHQLSPETISRIAAGEIIERPAYALKELIENAIDAGASEIHIALEGGGLDLIEVVDNGIGMSTEDIEEAAKPHTTSKIQSEDPLSAIHTYGFRGEALSSIASVSRLVIESKQEGEVGTQVVWENGKQINSKPIGMDTGTRIQIIDLFGNTPTRKKFLASEKIETHHLLHTALMQALAHPEITFTLTHNNRSLLAVLPSDPDTRTKEVLGTSFAQYLFPLNAQDSFVTLKGFLSHPVLAQKSDAKMYVFINNRPVKDPLVIQAIREAYGSLLAARSYPPCVLFLTVPVERTDVNIHPRKEQIKFLDKEFVFQTITRLIKDQLTTHNLTFSNVSWSKDVSLPLGISERKLPENTALATALKVHINETLPLTFQQVDNTYVIITNGKKIILMDQHAADERILFEKLQTTMTTLTKEKNVFTFSVPIILDVSSSEKQILLSQAETLERLGIVIEDFAGNSVKLVSIPHLMHDYDPLRFITDLLSQIQESDSITDTDKLTQRIMTTLSCRYAIMAGQSLTETQMKALWEKLHVTENNATCPHGRPTHIEIGIEELQKLFKR